MVCGRDLDPFGFHPGGIMLCRAEEGFTRRRRGVAFAGPEVFLIPEI